MPRERNQQSGNTEQSKSSSAGSGAQSTQSARNTLSRQSTKSTQSSRDASNAENTRDAQGERERSLQTNRDQGSQTQRTGGVSRREGLAPVYGGAGVLGNPFAVMQQLSDDMDRLFEQLGFGRAGYGLTPSIASAAARDPWTGSTRRGRTEQGLWAPQVEVLERGNNLVIRADLPGVDRNDVHVEIDRDMLTISGERREQHEEERDGFFRSERSYGEFRRAIPLPEGVNPEQVEASYKDGVLEITLPAPKAERAQSKRIPIR